MTTEEQVAELREKGLSPKAIARALSLRPAEVSGLIQKHAAALAARADQSVLAPLEACFVSPGWAAGLGLRGEARSWARNAGESSGANGLVTVFVARKAKYDQFLACCYLVDVYCLGVKNLAGPRLVKPAELTMFARASFSRYPGEPVPAPLELARHVIFGAEEYARNLGFEPHPDFARARGLLGPREAPSLIDFGCDGTPEYVNGPRDDVGAVLATLRRTVGEGNFRFMLMDGGP